ncbi:hypothetical protein GCM10010965_14650 [Caldalkalibacillus thermarum]|uniref:hypothetical protein n=1 Tax=Caldalkalibacillus thermarum TaxID=296745 RepID=UPI00166DF83F|nr:hypothetical protein [Caldalkalibacillus thermarum]GGK22812.1 hypothetical protein GCM10010965_14650 [Caldalkalibacillus thermarum]
MKKFVWYFKNDYIVLDETLENETFVKHSYVGFSDYYVSYTPNKVAIRKNGKTHEEKIEVEEGQNWKNIGFLRAIDFAKTHEINLDGLHFIISEVNDPISSSFVAYIFNVIDTTRDCFFDDEYHNRYLFFFDEHRLRGENKYYNLDDRSKSITIPIKESDSSSQLQEIIHGFVKSYKQKPGRKIYYEE